MQNFSKVVGYQEPQIPLCPPIVVECQVVNEILCPILEKTQSYLVVIPPLQPETSLFPGLQFIFRHTQGVGGGQVVSICIPLHLIKNSSDL